jgi:C4-dicarboxylate-specific signal transduction histidine kinase
MATGIAHEINQPLAIIRMAADGLNEFFSDKAKSNSSEAREARKIVSQSARAASIIDNMRSFARNDIEPAEPVDLRDSIETALSFFREQFRIHGIHLHVDLPDSPVQARVNPSRFQQIIVNLLSNARHAVEEKGRTPGTEDSKAIAVRLLFTPSSGTAVLEIEDNGAGMPPSVRERCMEPFFTTKEVGEGTGLGLSIARSIARDFQMELEVSSTEEKGSIFRVHMKIDRDSNHTVSSTNREVIKS